VKNAGRTDRTGIHTDQLVSLQVVGTVSIAQVDFGIAFGGFNPSGIGREGGP
jgi:hypothetical protein